MNTRDDFNRGQIKENSNGSFTAEDHVIKSVSLARQVYHSFRTKHLKRIGLASQIYGLVQGNPPYDPSEIRAAGLTHISNFNDMSPRSAMERVCLAYWNLINKAQYPVRFVIRGVRDPKLPVYEESLARNWKFAVLEHWPEFLVNLAMLQSQIVHMGLSPAIFHDERDPCWRVVDYSRFFIADQASSDINYLNSFCVETDFTIPELWGIYQEFHDKKDSPWNTKELGKLLHAFTSAQGADNFDTLNELDVAKRLFSGDVTWDNYYSDTVRLVSMFQKEYNGKISHKMFHRDLGYSTSATGNLQQSGNSSTISEDFLFCEEAQYDRMRDVLILFTMNPGESVLHANRGFGHKIFSLAQAEIQMANSVVDMAKWASTPILKGSSLATKNPDLIRWTPGVPIDIGASDFVENTMGANLEAVIGTAQFLRNRIRENVTYSGADPASPDPDAGSENPIQTKYQAYNEFSVQKNHIDHHYTGLDILFRLMTIRMYYSKESYPHHEISKTWKKRCIEDGVPEEVFDTERERTENGMPNHLEVYATRVLGAGSQAAQIMALGELAPIVGSLSVRQQKTYTQMLISSALGPEHLDTFDVDENEMDERGGGASLAALENAVMQMAKSPVWSNDNEHRSHFATHMALAEQIINGIQQQQMEPVEADTILNLLVPHLGQHLQALTQNPFAQSFFQKAKTPFDQVQRFATLNRRNAAKILQARLKEQRENQEQQEQVMTDAQREDYKAARDEQRKDLKLVAQANRQKEAGELKGEVLQEKTNRELAIKERKAREETRIKALSAGVESANESLNEANSDPGGYLDRMSETTPAPYDIEGGGTPTV